MVNGVDGLERAAQSGRARARAQPLSKIPSPRDHPRGELMSCRERSKYTEDGRLVLTVRKFRLAEVLEEPHYTRLRSK